VLHHVPQRAPREVLEFLLEQLPGRTLRDMVEHYQKEGH